MVLLLLCHGYIEQNPSPFTQKDEKFPKKVLCYKKRKDIDHRQESYSENLVKRIADARKLSLSSDSDIEQYKLLGIQDSPF